MTPETVTVNGRERMLWPATAWWAKRHPDARQLLCVHGVSIGLPCDGCTTGEQPRRVA